MPIAATGAGPRLPRQAPGLANELYEYFCELVRADMGDVQTGSFGADMSVSLVNDGPFTIVLDTDEL